MNTGYYKHYKGATYSVTGFAKHTETEDELVIYRDIKGNVWARPLSMWNETVDGKLRFKRYKDQRDGMLKFNLQRNITKNTEQERRI